MTAENQNIEVYQEDDFVRYFDVTEDGNAKDLSSVTPRWGAARFEGDEVVLSDADNDISVTVSNASAGEVKLAVSGDATATISGDFVHELELEDAQGNTVTVSRGRFTVLDDTR
jgi:hypothetical protein